MDKYTKRGSIGNGADEIRNGKCIGRCRTSENFRWYWLERSPKGHDGLAKRTKKELETKQDAATDSQYPQPKFTV